MTLELLAVRTTSYTWDYDGAVTVGNFHRVVFRLPNDADIISVYMRRRNRGEDTIVMNIVDDGVVIFSPTIPKGQDEHLYTTVPIEPILAGSIISLSAESGFATDLVVQLDLEETVDDRTTTERA